MQSISLSGTLDLIKWAVRVGYHVVLQGVALSHDCTDELINMLNRGMTVGTFGIVKTLYDPYEREQRPLMDAFGEYQLPVERGIKQYIVASFKLEVDEDRVYKATNSNANNLLNQFFEEQPEKTTMAEINLAALLREDTRTVQVRFYQDSDYDGNGRGKKLYTYVTHLDVKPGDHAVVLVANTPKLVYVETVDADANIQPQSSTKIKWLVGVVKAEVFEEARLNEGKNAEIENVYMQHYRNAARRSFAQAALMGMDEDGRNRLQALIGKGE